MYDDGTGFSKASVKAKLEDPIETSPTSINLTHSLDFQF